MAQRNEPSLLAGVERIGNCPRERVGKHRYSAFERHPMFGEIPFRLVRIPLELHGAIIRRTSVTQSRDVDAVGPTGGFSRGGS